MTGESVYRVPAPGEPAGDLEDMLGVDEQPGVRQVLAAELAAARAAEHQASVNMAGYVIGENATGAEVELVE